MGKKIWLGSKPIHCDICHGDITNEFIDGCTTYGPWANMCPSCHKDVGRGLGTGRGQKYRLNSDGEFEKVEG